MGIDLLYIGAYIGITKHCYRKVFPYPTLCFPVNKLLFARHSILLVVFGGENTTCTARLESPTTLPQAIRFHCWYKRIASSGIRNRDAGSLRIRRRASYPLVYGGRSTGALSTELTGAVPGTGDGGIWYSSIPVGGSCLLFASVFINFGMPSHYPSDMRWCYFVLDWHLVLPHALFLNRSMHNFYLWINQWLVQGFYLLVYAFQVYYLTVQITLSPCFLYICNLKEHAPFFLGSSVCLLVKLTAGFGSRLVWNAEV